MNSIQQTRINSVRLNEFDFRPIAVAGASLAVLILDSVTPLGLAVWVFQVALVGISTYWASRAQISFIAAVCAIGVVIGFVLSPRDRPAIWVDWCNLAFGLAAIAGLVQACFRFRASEHRVRILSGLLPICAWCKRIRGKNGAWEQLEVYVHRNSEAEFSHGICDECSARVRQTDID